MRYIQALCLCLGCVFQSLAQTVTVLDQQTGEPVFNVAIYNKSKTISVLTDFDGKANLSVFEPEALLFFSHVAHKPFHTTLRRLAQEDYKVWMMPRPNLLQEVVISASKFQQDRKDVAQKVIAIGRSAILTTSPQTSADLLESTGQVFVQKSQLGGGSPMIRGFATNRLLITVDGVRMNTAIFRGGNVQNIIAIDPLSVARTEVVFGPGSVIYGSDAIGGVMNFFTLDAEFSTTSQEALTGAAYTRYATANQEKTAHVNVNYGGERWALRSSVSYSDFGDLRMGSHGPESYLRPDYVVVRNGQDEVVENPDPRVQVPTGYSQINLLQKIRYQPAEDWDLDLGVIYTASSDYPRYDRLYRKRDGQFRAAEWYYGPQKWLQTRLTVGKAGRGELFDDAKFTAAYQHFQESRNDRDFQSSTLFRTKEAVDAWSANLDFEKSFGSSRLFYGMEGVYNAVDSEGSRLDISSDEILPGASRYPDNSSWTSLAAYGSYQWQPWDKWSLQTGLRYNHFLLEAQFDPAVYDFPFQDASLSAGALTGSFQAVWQQHDMLSWMLNLGTAFRAPNIDDVGKIFDSAPGMVVVPNPDLKAETAYHAELGAKLLPSEAIQLGLTGYYTYLDDALVRRDYEIDGQTHIEYQGERSRIQAIQNAAKAEVYGLEFSGKYSISDALALRTFLNWTNGFEEQDDGTSAPLRHAAPLFGAAHLQYDQDRIFLDLFAEFNGAVESEDLAPSERDKPYLYALNAQGQPYAPSWYTLNLTGRYSFSESLLATIGLRNITDQRYRTYSSGIAAAGRNLILALRYSFE